jgi:hypothetical protein
MYTVTGRTTAKGNLNDLIPAAKNSGIDFIFLTDHPRHDLDTFPRGYKGYYDGILIEPGSEKHGFAVWPLDSVIIDWTTDREIIAENILSGGEWFLFRTRKNQGTGKAPFTRVWKFIIFMPTPKTNGCCLTWQISL